MSTDNVTNPKTLHHSVESQILIARQLRAAYLETATVRSINRAIDFAVAGLEFVRPAQPGQTH